MPLACHALTEVVRAQAMGSVDLES
jgi:hypothetical protein